MILKLEVYWNSEKDEPSKERSDSTRSIELFSVGALYVSRGITVVWTAGCRLCAVKDIGEVSDLIKRCL